MICECDPRPTTFCEFCYENSESLKLLTWYDSLSSDIPCSLSEFYKIPIYINLPFWLQKFQKTRKIQIFKTPCKRWSFVNSHWNRKSKKPLSFTNSGDKKIQNISLKRTSIGLKKKKQYSLLLYECYQMVTSCFKRWLPCVIRVGAIVKINGHCWVHLGKWTLIKSRLRHLIFYFLGMVSFYLFFKKVK